MSSLSSVEAELPPGFRFHPRDEELICDYLMKWVAGSAHPLPLLIGVDLNKSEPWDIPEIACVGGKDWYFYSQRDRKYATGLRTNRATVSGYWKATGKDRAVIRNAVLVGMRKTLVFYQGRAPKGRKTGWVMHEFRLDGPGPKPNFPAKGDWVLCRMFFKSRSENPTKSQEEGNISDMAAYPPSLPPLTDPFFSFDDEDQYHEQVPCFSILNASPFFSLINHTDPPQIAATSGGYGFLAPMNGCDEKVMIKAVLNHLTRTETGNDQTNMKAGSSLTPPYLSEVVWKSYT
uniref:Transcription factor n=1 Tax=Lavandula angustifolia TaxID=39329 RepID=A0A654JSM2_LAVAN|nr:transcription factor [Lavandula angustifolia]